MINYGFLRYPLINNRTIPASKKLGNGVAVVLPMGIQMVSRLRSEVVAEVSFYKT